VCGEGQVNHFGQLILHGHVGHKSCAIFIAADAILKFGLFFGLTAELKICQLSRFRKPNVSDPLLTYVLGAYDARRLNSLALCGFMRKASGTMGSASWKLWFSTLIDFSVNQ
jgi:hypothetical protein